MPSVLLDPLQLFVTKRGNTLIGSDEKPIIFLAFANEHDNRVPQAYLRHLPQEVQGLRQALRKAEEKDLCQLEVLPNATLSEIRDVFRKHNDRIAIFHFGGHADSYGLLFEGKDGQTEEINAEGFAEFLAQQAGLQLVFLNACSTDGQVKALHAAGVPVVIATTTDVPDKSATEFASEFYQSLAIGTNSISKSFNEAAALVKARHGGNIRRIRPDKPVQGPSSKPYWNLHTARDAKENAEWSLQIAVGDPLIDLPPIAKSNRLPKSPFRYLNRYVEEEAQLFFGRAKKIRELYDFIRKGFNPVILLFGQSGVGKSSLLEAGLISRLRRDYQICYFRQDEEHRPLLVTLRSKLQEFMNDTSDLRTAWLTVEQTSKNQQGQKRPLIVIIDQLESIYLPGQEESGELSELFDSIKNVFKEQKNSPEGKLLLGFRKEWLANIEQQLEVNKIGYHHAYLRGLSRDSIIEIVKGPTSSVLLRQQYKLQITSNLAETIADNLQLDIESALAPTLQILLTRMWDEAYKVSSERPTFTDELFRTQFRGSNLLALFLDDQLPKVAKELPIEWASGLILDVLYAHMVSVNDRGANALKPNNGQKPAESHPLGISYVLNLAKLQEIYAHLSPVLLKKVIHQCKDKRLLVDPDLDSTENSEYKSTRLVHDSLVSLVQDKFFTSVFPGQQARLILESRVTIHDSKGNSLQPVNKDRSTWKAHIPQFVYDFWKTATNDNVLESAVLKVVEEGKNGMRDRTEDEKRLIEASCSTHSLRQTIRNIGIATICLLFAVGIYFFLAERYTWLSQQRIILGKASEFSTESALQLLTIDPVNSTRLSLSVLPKPEDPRPYEAEPIFSLMQGLRSSLEIQFSQASTKPLIREKVTISDKKDKVAFLNQDGVEVKASNFITSYGSIDSKMVGKIDCVAWRPQSEQILICGESTFWLWQTDGSDLQEVIPIRDYLAKIERRDLPAIAWSPDGSQFAAVIGWGGETVIVNVDILELEEFDSGEYEVEQLAFVDLDTLITKGYGDGYEVRLWSRDENSWKIEHIFDTGVAVPEGFALSPERQQLLIFLENGEGQLWDLADLQLLSVLRGHSKIRAASWQPSQHLIATSGRDGTIRIWDAVPTEAVELTVLRGHTNRDLIANFIDVEGVYWLDDHDLLSYGEDGTFRRWRVIDKNGIPLCAGFDPEALPRCHDDGWAARIHSADVEFAKWLDPETLITTDTHGEAARILVNDEGIVAYRVLTDTRYITTGLEGRPTATWNPAGNLVFTYLSHNAIDARRKQIEESELSVNESELDQDGSIRRFDNEFQGENVQQIVGPIESAEWLSSGLLVSKGSTDAGDASVKTVLYPHAADPTSSTLFAPEIKLFDGIAKKATENNNGLLALGDDRETVWVWDKQISSVMTHTFASDGSEAVSISDLVWSNRGDRLIIAAGRVVWSWNFQLGEVISLTRLCTFFEH